MSEADSEQWQQYDARLRRSAEFARVLLDAHADETETQS